MIAVPAARYLADFGADGDARAPHAGGAPVKNDSVAAAARIDEAFARGIDDGRAAAESEFETKLEEQRAEFAAQLAAETAGVGGRNGRGTGKPPARRLCRSSRAGWRRRQRAS